MRIGEVAERAGVTDKTIRYYEQIGVLASPSRTASGYRDYDDSVLDRLQFVRAAQAVGLTLGEIREVIALRDHGTVPCEHVVDVIRRRASQIDQRIAELQQIRTELERLDRRAETLDPRDCPPDKVCHLIT